jgi:outer membrane protein assembly factor BamB
MERRTAMKKSMIVSLVLLSMHLSLYAQLGFDKVWQLETADTLQAPFLLDKSACYISSHDGNLYRVDAQKGTVVWRFQTDGLISSTAAFDHNTLFIGSADRYFYAIDAASGEEKWRFQTGDWVTRSAVIVRDTVIVGGADGLVYGLDKQSGKELWRHDFYAAISADLAVQGNLLYVATVENDIHALNLRNKKLIWSATLFGRAVVRPIVEEGVLYVADSTKHITALDTLDGSTVWRFETYGGVRVPISLQGGSLYAASMDMTLYRLDKQSGKLQHEYAASDQITALALGEEQIFLGTEQGYLVVLDNRAHYRDSMRLDSQINTISLQEDQLYLGDKAGTAYRYALEDKPEPLTPPAVLTPPTPVEPPVSVTEGLSIRSLDQMIKNSSLKYTHKGKEYILQTKGIKAHLKPLVCEGDKCHVLQISASIDMQQLTLSKRQKLVNTYNQKSRFIRHTLEQNRYLKLSSELSLDDPIVYEDIKTLLQTFLIGYVERYNDLKKEQK